MTEASWNTYEEDSVQWVQNTLATPVVQSGKSGAPPGTPIITNTAKVPTEGADLGGTEGIGMPPFQLPHRAAEPEPDMMRNNDYNRHHDALWSLVHHRRAAAIGNGSRVGADERFISQAEEGRFLSALAPVHPVWALLSTMRNHLGDDALLWDDSEAGKRREILAVDEVVHQSALSSVRTGAAAFLDTLRTETGPRLIQRRGLILDWLRECYAARLPPKRSPVETTMWRETLDKLKNQGDSSLSGLVHPDGRTFMAKSVAKEAWYTRDHHTDDDLVEQCLGLVVANKLDHAVALAAEYGQPWRSAAWQPPSDYGTRAGQLGGNRTKRKWKEQCGKLAKQTTGAESALYSFLSCEIDLLLTKPEFQSWEASFLVCYHAMFEQQCDTIADQRTRLFEQTDRPGHTNRSVHSASMMQLNEAAVVAKLESSPFKHVRASDLFQQMASAFIVGRNAVTMLLEGGLNLDEASIEEIQFLCHLLGFIDQVGYLQVHQDLKTRTVLRYLRHLANFPTLWQSMTLYASLLPDRMVLSEFPDMLGRVEAKEQRRVVLRQIDACFSARLGKELVRRVVHTAISNVQYGPNQKLKFLDWFFLSMHRFEDALIGSNRLSRQQLLLDNTKTPQDIFQMQCRRLDEASEEERAALSSAGRSSVLEAHALGAFLDALMAYKDWQTCISKDDYQSPNVSLTGTGTGGPSETPAADRDIQSMSLRVLQREGKSIVEVAVVAYRKLGEVLTRDGGFLLEEEDDDDDDDEGEHDGLLMQEDMRQFQGNDSATTYQDARKKELYLLRNKCVPDVVDMLYDVCERTSRWLDSQSTPTSQWGSTNHVGTVSTNTGDDHSSPSSPVYWTLRAKEVAVTVASEEYKIHETLTPARLEKLCRKLSQTCEAGLGNLTQAPARLVEYQ